MPGPTEEGKTAMKTETVSFARNRMDIGHEISIFLLTVCLVMAILIAVWGFACMIGGLITHSPADLIRGLAGAITGG